MFNFFLPPAFWYFTIFTVFDMKIIYSVLKSYITQLNIVNIIKVNHYTYLDRKYYESDYLYSLSGHM